jgi:hypothetical protein
MSRFGLLVLTILLCAGCGGDSTGPDDSATPASIELSSDTLSAFQDRDTPLPTVTVFSRSHRVIPFAVQWSSGDTNIAKVLPNNFLKSNSTLGMVLFTVTAGTVSQTLHVKVIREPVSGVLITPRGTVLNGNDSVQFTAITVGNAADELPGRVITWGALDPAIATISATGVAHIHSSGTGRITASSEGVTDTVGIVADARLVARITVVPDALVMVPGAQAAPFLIHQFDASGNELFDRRINNSSSDSTIVTTGALAKRVGTATLTLQADTATFRIPVTVATITLASVVTGGSHACGLTPAHAAYCWGYDGIGETGTNPFAWQGDAAPAPVRGGLSFTTLAAGDTWTCGLIADGTPYCWGGVDMVGDGSLTPKKIPGVTLTTLSINGHRACGLDASGLAWCWNGDDLERLLFIPPTGCGNDCAWTPVATGNGTHWTMLSAGSSSHICGIVAGNVAECWGSNFNGQLGDGTSVNDSVPLVVHGGHAFMDISAGGGFTCGVTTANDAYCWGSDDDGTLGNGVQAPQCTEGRCIKIPTAVAGGHKFAYVRTNADHACGLTTDGAVYCWGYDIYGRQIPQVPVLRSGGVTFTTLSVNGFDCGMATDGKAYCLSGTGDPSAVLGQ